MARVALSEVVLEPQGRLLTHIDGASVTINVRGGSAATLYAAATGSTTVAQPLTTVYGRVGIPGSPDAEVWITAGSYDMAILTTDGRSWTQRVEAASGSAESGSPVSAASYASAGTDTAIISAAIADAAGRAVLLDRDYAVQDLAITDQDVHLIGPGRLLHASGHRVLTVEHTVGAARSVTSVATVNPRPDGVSNIAEAYTRINLAQADLADVQQGDLFLIGSNDAYPTEYVTGAAGIGTQTYPAAFVPVHALGLDIAGITGGGFAEGNTITGATSGATALLTSVATKSDATVMVAFAKFTGTFVNGENLQVGGTTRGTANGTPYIVAANRLLDTFTTTPKLYKAQQGRRCIIECNILATGDVDSIVGSANRLPAIELRGVVDGKVKLDVLSAWTRAVRLTSCYATRADVRLMKLPNNAATSEGAYGYGVEFNASSEFCTATVKARNVRHATTTNTGNWATWAGQPVLDGGVPKFNVVHDSESWNPLGAGFDTHAGGYFNEFRDCKVYGGGTVGRITTTPQGFQNRSFGTIYTNCQAQGCTIGFDDSSHTYGAPFQTLVRHLRCSALNYGMYGFRWNGPSTDALTSFEAEDCLASGDGTAQNTPNFQSGFINVGARVRWNRCKSQKFNGQPFRTTGSTGYTISTDCEADYTDSSTSSNPFRIDAAPSGGLTLFGYKVRTNGNGTTPGAAVQVTAGAVTMETDGVQFIGTDRPFSSVTGGSLTVTRQLKTGVEWTAQKTWDPPSVAAGGTTTTTLTLSDATAGDFVEVSFNLLNAAMVLTGSVDSANGVINVVLWNPTAGAIDLASGTLRALVTRRT